MSYVPEKNRRNPIVTALQGNSTAVRRTGEGLQEIIGNRSYRSNRSKGSDFMTDRQNGNMNRSDDDFGNTQYFKPQKEEESAAKKVLSVVYEALTTKGYDPVNQIVGYIMSGDPTYITNYMGARSLIMRVERDELVEEILRSYIRNNNW